jgi:NAD(P)H-hydrate epimerase
MNPEHIAIPAITTEQMRQVDQLMEDVYQIELKQMMENAGRHLAALARTRFLQDDPRDRRVLVLAGSGGNGGGGLVAARRLANWGAQVQVFLSKAADEMRGVPARQLRILDKMGIPLHDPADTVSLPEANLILDALIGYSLSGKPRGQAAALIQMANNHSAPILSLDTPSGLDTTSGQAQQPCVRATTTLTLALPKTGLLAQQAKSYVGELFLADISVPPDLYHHLGLEVGPIFAKKEIIPLP